MNKLNKWKTREAIGGKGKQKGKGKEKGKVQQDEP